MLEGEFGGFTFSTFGGNNLSALFAFGTLVGGTNAFHLLMLRCSIGGR